MIRKLKKITFKFKSSESEMGCNTATEDWTPTERCPFCDGLRGSTDDCLEKVFFFLKRANIKFLFNFASSYLNAIKMKHCIHKICKVECLEKKLKISQK